jgi:hypothetical protein
MRQGRKPSKVIRPLGKKVRKAPYKRLDGSGVVRAGWGRALGIFPARRWPVQDARRKAQVRELVIQALVQQTAPEMRSAALIGLLHVVGVEDKVVDPARYGLSGRQLGERAERIVGDSFAGVRKPVGQMIDAVRYAIIRSLLWELLASFAGGLGSWPVKSAPPDQESLVWGSGGAAADGACRGWGHLPFVDAAGERGGAGGAEDQAAEAVTGGVAAVPASGPRA